MPDKKPRMFSAYGVYFIVFCSLSGRVKCCYRTGLAITCLNMFGRFLGRFRGRFSVFLALHSAVLYSRFQRFYRGFHMGFGFAFSDFGRFLRVAQCFFGMRSQGCIVFGLALLNGHSGMF